MYRLGAVVPDVALTGLACNGTEERLVDCTSDAEVDETLLDYSSATTDRDIGYYERVNNIPGLGCSENGKEGFALACVLEEPSNADSSQAPIRNISGIQGVPIMIRHY